MLEASVHACNWLCLVSKGSVLIVDKHVFDGFPIIW